MKNLKVFLWDVSYGLSFFELDKEPIVIQVPDLVNVSGFTLSMTRARIKLVLVMQVNRTALSPDFIY